MNKLKPCPNVLCNSDGVYIKEYLSPGEPRYAIKCGDCGCGSVRYFSSEQKCIENWNKRPEMIFDDDVEYIRADKKNPYKELTKLKPCPFCGSKKSEIYTDYNSTYLTRRCKACNSKTGYFPKHVGDNKINDAWNKRPETAWEMFKRLLVIDEFREKLKSYMREVYKINNERVFDFLGFPEEKAIEIMQIIEVELERELNNKEGVE